ncbi:dimethylsulfonioproprionate lyase family protein [Albidovulum sp.]|uniref:dimethylsulfonioproprionate lyase family protein n=1 Tax=Albidovulum sp. TaxID=1872424 RepID=UPI0039B95A53
MTGAEDARARADLHAALGQPGSGRLRYAAAMHLHGRGLISPEALEVYRICSPHDREDPAGLLAARGLNLDLPPAGAPELAIRLLVEEVDRYLATLPGPGVAEVRSLTARWRSGPVTASAAPNPVAAAQLAPALAALAPGHPALAAAIGDAAPHLNWVTYDAYPPDEIGEAFRTGHAFASLIGDGAAIPAEDFDLGLFLVAPHVLYRDHAHPAPELYAPLTGPHGWRFGPGTPLILKGAHEPVWNLPEAPHLTKVGPVPFLCIFGWTKDTSHAARVIPAADWAALEAMRIEG